MTDMTAGSGCCWPEQEAVWAWMKRHGIELTFEQERDLKDSVTAYRITFQEELARARQALTAPRVPENIWQALYEAVSALYFDDGSDFESALWNVVDSLSPEIGSILRDNPAAAWHKSQALLTAAPAPAEQVTKVGAMEVTHDAEGRVSKVNCPMPLFTTTQGEEIKRLRERMKVLEVYERYEAICSLLTWVGRLSGRLFPLSEIQPARLREGGGQ